MKIKRTQSGFGLIIAILAFILLILLILFAIDSCPKKKQQSQVYITYRSLHQ